MLQPRLVGQQRVDLEVAQLLPTMQTRELDHEREAGDLAAQTLHQLDGESLDWIAIERVPDSTEWLGIRDRLDRAAG